MTTFQIFLIVVLSVLMLATIVAFARRTVARGPLLAWGLLWTVGLIAAIDPDLTTRLANRLGIRRGTDLLLYCTTLLGLTGLFVLYTKLRRVRRDLTILTRRLTLLDAKRGPADDDEESGSS